MNSIDFIERFLQKRAARQILKTKRTWGCEIQKIGLSKTLLA